jgi:hypothetical protein
VNEAQPYSAEREALQAELARVKVDLTRLAADLDRRSRAGSWLRRSGRHPPGLTPVH